MWTAAISVLIAAAVCIRAIKPRANRFVSAAAAVPTAPYPWDNPFIQVGDRVLFDQHDSLLWTRDIPELEMFWHSAQLTCTKATVHGVGGWRLPTKSELKWLVAPDGQARQLYQPVRALLPADGVVFSRELSGDASESEQPWVLDLRSGQLVLGGNRTGLAFCVHYLDDQAKKVFGDWSER